MDNINQLDLFIQKANELKNGAPDSPVVGLWKNNVRSFLESIYGTKHAELFDRCFRYYMLPPGSPRRQSSHHENLDRTIELLEALKSEPVSSAEAAEQEVVGSADEIKREVLEWMKTYQKTRPTVWPTSAQIVAGTRRYKKEDVISSIYFLTDEGWLKKRSLNKVEHFRLSSKTMDYFEPSEFKSHPASRVQITANNSIVLLGDNLGSIHQENIQGIQELDGLIEKIVHSPDVPKEHKLDAVADAETIKNQLLKPRPDRKIIDIAWGAVSLAANLAGAADFALKVAALLGIRI